MYVFIDIQGEFYLSLPFYRFPDQVHPFQDTAFYMTDAPIYLFVVMKIWLTFHSEPVPCQIGKRFSRQRRYSLCQIIRFFLSQYLAV